MIRTWWNSFEKFVTKGESLAIAAALLVALAVYSFLQTLVEGLIAPAISAVFSKEGIYRLTFRIEDNDFAYGSVLVGLILLALVLVVVAVLGRVLHGDDGRSTET